MHLKHEHMITGFELPSHEPRYSSGLKQLYFILWTMGENFPPNKTFTTADLRKHESYIRQAYTDGVLLMAALFENGNGFITLVEAENETEIHRFVRNNPEIVDKKLQARVKPCKPIYWKDFSLLNK